MRHLSLLLFLVFAVPAMAQRAPVLPAGRVVDLSYAFDAKSVYWPTAEAFKLDTDFEGVTDKGYFYSAYRYSAAEHGGTHLDAPVHFAKGRHTVDEIPLDQLMGSGIVIDVTSKCSANPDYQVGVADFQSWERTNGRI
jgi:kynurenine formamidase